MKWNDRCRGVRMRRLVASCVGVFVVGVSGCSALSPEPSANEVFEDYYAALTGTMSVSVHRDDYQWRGGYEKFPYPDEAKWTDFSPYISGCDNKDIAKIYGMFDTYGLNLGYENPQEAIDRVSAYWESQGWEVKDLSTPKDPDKKQILTVTDTDINLMYTASVIGEDIEVTSQCIPEFFDKDNPVEEPVVYAAQQ